VELFPDLATAVASLAVLGRVRVEAGEDFWEADGSVRKESIAEASLRLQRLFASESEAKRILARLWS